MSSRWAEARLGDMTMKIGSGATPRGGKDVYVAEGTAFIRSQNVFDNAFSSKGLARITDEAARDLKGATVLEGDVLVCITGESVTRTCLVDASVLPARVSQHVAIVRPNPAQLDSRYLKAALLSPPIKDLLNRLSQAGATRRALTKSHLESLEIPCPPLDEQRRIARVLGALDDLIQTNARQIALLVEAADVVAGRVGAIGEEVTFGEVAVVAGGGTPSTKESAYWGGPLPWATPSDMTALHSPYLFSTSRSITAAGLESCSSDLYPPGTILMTSRATIGVFAVAQKSVAVNQGFIVVQPRDEVDRWFLFHEMRRRVPEFLSRANGSTFLEISRGTFKSLPVIWPSRDDRVRLFREVDPLHRAAASLQTEIADLVRTRDELLPLLMSGRVRVRESAA